MAQNVRTRSGSRGALEPHFVRFADVVPAQLLHDLADQLRRRHDVDGVGLSLVSRRGTVSATTATVPEEAAATVVPRHVLESAASPDGVMRRNGESVFLPVRFQQRVVAVVEVRSGELRDAQLAAIDAELASWALMLENLAVLDEALARAANLTLALESRSEIEQAKGIIMAREACSAEQAFAMLRARSQNEHVKLATLAHELVGSTRRDLCPRETGSGGGAYSGEAGVVDDDGSRAVDQPQRAEGSLAEGVLLP